MCKKFNVAGLCKPEKHYMVDISDRLDEIEELIKDGAYFTINKGRQYGKTTALSLLKRRLEKEYTVFFISFEGMGEESFADSNSISHAFCDLLYDTINYGEVKGIADDMAGLLCQISEDRDRKMSLRDLSNIISKICMGIHKPVILIIDEVDQAGNYKSFVEFLGLLREKFLKRDTRPTFQSVVLAGVYDIKNLKLKIRGGGKHQYNSPWNIAVNADIRLDFQISDIAGMIAEYEKDHRTGMNIKEVAKTLYDYTSGYPFLVSRLCQIMDQQLCRNDEFSDKEQIWSKRGILDAVKLLLTETNTLFDDMRKKLEEFTELRDVLNEILYSGKSYPFNQYNSAIDIAKMFGYVKDNCGKVAVSNRLFETWLYNLFVSEESLGSLIYDVGSVDKNQFVVHGHLDMR